MRVHMRSIKLLLLLIGMLFVRGQLSAQQTYCYPLRSDSLHAVFRDNIRVFTSNPDSAWNASGVALGFPRVAASFSRVLGAWSRD